ncbi:hypothetical protein V6N13_106160 [Hibiscus sabdariffa]
MRRATTPSSPWLREAPEINANFVKGCRGDICGLIDNPPFLLLNHAMSTMGLSVGFDTPMVTATEDVPIENVEGSKRPRVQTSPPGFSGSSYLHGALVQLSAGLVNEASRQQ